MTTYLLLAPVDMYSFEDSMSLFQEALDEFGLSYITSAGSNYITCKNLDTLTQAAFTLDLPGNIVVYSAIYESTEEEIEIIKE